jgi:hypothetical protein
MSLTYKWYAISLFFVKSNNIQLTLKNIPGVCWWLAMTKEKICSNHRITHINLIKYIQVYEYDRFLITYIYIWNYNCDGNTAIFIFLFRHCHVHTRLTPICCSLTHCRWIYYKKKKNSLSNNEINIIWQLECIFENMKSMIF